METQHQRIYNYMKSHGSITPMECFEALRITKLSTRIGEMKRQGIRIADEMVYGKTSRYKRYWLEPEERKVEK